MGQFGIGQPVPREEDPVLLRDRGRFVDDVRLVGTAHGYFLRSPHAHARIRRVDVAIARRFSTQSLKTFRTSCPGIGVQPLNTAGDS